MNSVSMNTYIHTLKLIPNNVIVMIPSFFFTYPTQVEWTQEGICTTRKFGTVVIKSVQFSIIKNKHNHRKKYKIRNTTELQYYKMLKGKCTKYMVIYKLHYNTYISTLKEK